MPEYILTLIQDKGKIAFFFLSFASTKNESPKGKKKTLSELVIEIRKN